MIDCKKCEDLIQHELDGEITRADKARLDSHIEGCDECRKLKEEYTSLREFLNGDEPIAPPDDFVANLTSRLEDQPRVGFIEGYIVPFILQNQIRFALASFILVIAGFTLMFNYYQHDTTLGGFLEPTPTASNAYIGIHNNGQPTFFIPADDGGYIIDGERDQFTEIEKFFEKDIIVASD